MKRTCKVTSLFHRGTRGFLLVLALSMCLVLTGGCISTKSSKPEKTKVVLWIVNHPSRDEGFEYAMRVFEERHPNIHIQRLSIGAGTTDPQKLMTAIAGKVPPDLISQERSSIGDWASRDAFIPMDDLIARDRNTKYGVRPEEYYPGCWGNVVYKGKVYGVPSEVGDIALLYNRRMFREAGLDPNKPPRTWDELVQVAKKFTKYNEDRSLRQVGLLRDPNNADFLFLLACQNGGDFMSADGKTCTINSPRVVEALKFATSMYDQLGGAVNLDAFTLGSKENADDPFVLGQVAMEFQAHYYLNAFAMYAPDLDFGVAPVPVPRERYEGKGRFAGQPRYITANGGNAWVIPAGAKHVNEAWEFIKWITSEDGLMIIHQVQKEYRNSQGQPYTPWLSANRVYNEKIVKKFGGSGSINQRVGLKQYVDLLPYGRFLPVTPANQIMGVQQLRSVDMALHHKKSPQAALDEAQREVQKQLDKIQARKKYKLLNPIYPLAIVLVIIGIVITIAVIQYRKRPPLGRLARGENLAGLMFASPWLTGFLLFTLGPIIVSLILSFCDYDVMHPARWVGLANYHGLLTDDWYYMSKSMGNAIYLAVFGLPLGMITSFSIAMLLNTEVRGMKYFRTIFYLPSILPIVANAVLWGWILNPQFGLMNVAWRATLTSWFHIPAPMWLAGEASSKPAFIVMGLWSAGGGMILWLAGLQGVPRQLHEAAEIDGAGWWCRLRNVTLPMLTPYIFFNLIMGVIGVIQSFDTQYVMTSGYGKTPGGPVDSTLVPVLYLFQNAFSYFKMGYASAIAWLLFIVILILTLLQLRMAKLWVYYEGDKGN